MAKRTLSTAAQAAKLIRKEIKPLGVKASVTSDNFAGGDAVRICLTNPLPSVADKVRALKEKYVWGSFNGMEDIYESKGEKSDLPQVKYASVSVDYTDDIKQACYEKVLAYFNDQNKYDMSIYPKQVSDLCWSVPSPLAESGWDVNMLQLVLQALANNSNVIEELNFWEEDTQEEDNQEEQTA